MNAITILAQSISAEAGSDRWSQMFFGLNQEQRFVLMIVAIGCATGVICTLVGCLSGLINSTHRRRLEAEMKQDLVERGMSSDEIAQIIEATPLEDGVSRWIASWGKCKRN
jgi:hypothetical protein